MPPLTVTDPVSGKTLLAPEASTPPVTNVPPVWVLLPVSVSVPAPTFRSEPPALTSGPS